MQIGKTLPATPRILGKLQSLLADPNSGIDEICKLLKGDVALTARLIRASNSPYYGGGSSHSSLEDAVNCVGYSEVYRLVGLVVGSQLITKDMPCYRYTSVQVWDNALMTAVASEALARVSGCDPMSAYTAGLMKSIGKLVLDRVAVEVLAPKTSLFDTGQGRLLALEEAAFGC
ncbi:MAG TPA: HDOD domain-containing protein, partial [Opitutaceae bacterium]|nr:HDOD domain-containing protein [Opitutaceae bacterium]